MFWAYCRIYLFLLESLARLIEHSKSTGLSKKGKGSPYSITDHNVPELIPVLGSQPAGDLSHKSGGRLPLLSAVRLLPDSVAAAI